MPRILSLPQKHRFGASSWDGRFARADGLPGHGMLSHSSSTVVVLRRGRVYGRKSVRSGVVATRYRFDSELHSMIHRRLPLAGLIFDRSILCFAAKSRTYFGAGAISPPAFPRERAPRHARPATPGRRLGERCRTRPCGTSRDRDDDAHPRDQRTAGHSALGVASGTVLGAAGEPCTTCHPGGCSTCDRRCVSRSAARFEEEFRPRERLCRWPLSTRCDRRPAVPLISRSRVSVVVCLT